MDELNEFQTEYGDVAETIEEFYEVMDISEEQKEERRNLANELFNVFLFLFALMGLSRDNGYVNLDYMSLEFELRFAPIVKSYARADEYMNRYIRKVTDDVVDTTYRHADEEYFLSDDRALGIALNESNSVLNYEELAEAVENGMNVKVWHTMKDRRVRDTHRPLEGMRIGIAEFFPVGDSLLLFPRDEENCENMADIANCRCSLSFEYDSSYPVYAIDDYSADEV